jgi:tetratricopeptide (TPR) repeat protein
MKKHLIFLYCIFILSSIANAQDTYTHKLKEGIRAVNSGSFIVAEGIFNSLIEREPSRPEAYCGMAIVNISTKKFEAAKEYVLIAIEKKKEYSQSYYLMGIVEEQLSNYNSALESYNRYLELEPDSKKIQKILKRIDYLKERLSNE